jgi:hypothetical protein
VVQSATSDITIKTTIDVPFVSTKPGPAFNMQFSFEEMANVVGTVIVFGQIRFALEDAIGIHNVAGIETMAEFMVKVLHSRMPLGCTMVLGLKLGYACDVISVVAGFMVDVAGVASQPSEEDSNSIPLGRSPSLTVPTLNCDTMLKAWLGL